MNNQYRTDINFAQLCMFTPCDIVCSTDKRIYEKRFDIRTNSDGYNKVHSIIINSKSNCKLPDAQDQHIYFSFYRMLMDRFVDSKISKIISFTPSDIIKYLGIRAGGSTYKSIENWLITMKNIAIQTMDYHFVGDNNKQEYKKLGFYRVFNSVEITKEDDVHTKYTVELSKWILNNMNNGIYIFMDKSMFDMAKKLSTKVLIPLIHALLCTRDEDGNIFQNYANISKMLGYKNQYKMLSQQKRQLKSTLDELSTIGYIDNWTINKGSIRLKYSQNMINNFEQTYAIENNIQDESTDIDNNIQENLAPTVRINIVPNTQADKVLNKQEEKVLNKQADKVPDKQEEKVPNTQEDFPYNKWRRDMVELLKEYGLDRIIDRIPKTCLVKEVINVLKPLVEHKDFTGDLIKVYRECLLDVMLENEFGPADYGRSITNIY